jgi:hypothetical protein
MDVVFGIGAAFLHQSCGAITNGTSKSGKKR